LVEYESVRDIKPKDSAGYEFNRYTLTGEYDDVFKALIIQHEKENLDDALYFSIFLQNHIERGISLLHTEYEKINSPVDFLVALSSTGWTKKDEFTDKIEL